MLLVSWNVNGLRAVMKKGFSDSVAQMDADVLCLQEIKTTAAKAKLTLRGYPFQLYNPGERAGYSGTALFSRIEPIDITAGLGVPSLDTEGRVITAEFDDFFLVTSYTPNSGRGLPRLAYRTQEWDPAFREHCQGLDAHKPVVLCGDLNVAHQAIDIARPSANRRSAGFTEEEREGFTQLLSAGFVDTFRHRNPDATGRYSWWSYMGGARARNVGWRLDYFVVSQRILSRVQDAQILADVMGSDHCPVSLTLA